MTIPTTPDENTPGSGSSDFTVHSPKQPTQSIRLGTIVWGAILVAIAVGIIAVAAGASIDVELAVIVGFAAAGVALVVGSIAVSVRKNKGA